MTRHITRISVLGTCLFWATASTAFALGGLLDPTFNGSGKSIFNVDNSPAQGSFSDVIIVGGNKILVTGGVVLSGGSYYAVTLRRFNADGSLDSSFGSGGTVITDIGVTALGEAIAVQSDGRIVVAANAGSHPARLTAVLRYMPDGALDTTFGSNGVFSTSVMKVARDIRIVAGDKIVIAGISDVPNLGRTQVTKLNANGTLDTSFGNNGITTSTYFAGSDTDKLVVQGDGKIIVSGRNLFSVPKWLVHRFNADGSPDATFGTAGIRELNSGGSMYPGGLVLQPDGKIVMSGFASAAGPSNTALLLTRLNPDGSTDDSFGGGFVSHDLTPDYDRAYDLAIQTDGKLVIGGQYDDNQAVVARVNSTGELDLSFDTDGIRLLSPANTVSDLTLHGSDLVGIGFNNPNPFLARVDSAGSILLFRNEGYVTGNNDQAQDVAIQLDGKIVAAGNTVTPNGRPALSVARLLANGTPDIAFANGGRFVLNAPPSFSEAYAVVIQPDGKTVVAGRHSAFGSFSSYSLLLVRLNPDGSLDATFGSGGLTIIDLSPDLVAYDIELQADGKIVIGGSSKRVVGDGVFNFDLMAARLNPNGTPDVGFGANGVFIHITGSATSPEHEQASALALLPNGKIILAGTHLLRLNSNGAVDGTFSPTPVPLAFPATDMRLQPDGKFVLSGTTNSDLAVARRNSDGSVDTDFGAGGNAILDFGGADAANTICLEPNGDILAGGSTLGGDPFRRRFAIARLKPNGQPDPRFGSLGRIITDVAGDAIVFGLARQPDGKFVAAGEAKPGLDRDFALARYLSRTSPFDFDGDGQTDLGIFRPSAAEWWIDRSSDGSTLAAQFGSTLDRIVPADYTGDGHSDMAFWRPSTGEWFVLRSEDFSYYAVQFGSTGDIPVPADYDADGRADVAVFRPSSGTWFISRSTGGTGIEQFGVNGDVPVVADYDGDARADIAIYRPTVRQWWLKRSTAGVIAMTFGNAGDKPVQGDYTGDGRSDVAFWRPSDGNWFVLRSEDFSYYAVQFGLSSDTPAPGDYDGDGRIDTAVFRSSGATWFVNRSTAGILIRQFGVASDTPIPSAYVP